MSKYAKSGVAVAVGGGDGMVGDEECKEKGFSIDAEF